MSQNNANITLSGSQKIAVAGQKSLTPAGQGVANSHGVKLSVNMTSNDKKKLLIQLEEWRKSKREKIAAAMLAKQKQADKAKMSLPVLPIKSKPVPLKNSTGQQRQSVFERLYRNEKIKKSEIPISKENSSKATKPVPHPVYDQINVTNTQSAPQPVMDKIKILENKPDPYQHNDQDENAETRPSPNPINVQTELGGTELPSHETNNKNEEFNPPHPVSLQIEIEGNKPVLQEINDQNENVETQLISQTISDEIESTETKVASEPIHHDIKFLEAGPASQAFQNEIKIAETNPAPQNFSDQIKDANKKPKEAPVVFSGQIKSIKPMSVSSGQIKTTESKPVKSGLAKSSLPVKRVDTGNGKVILRRSLSMMFHQKRKEQNILRRSISSQNIPKLKPQKQGCKTSQMLPPPPPSVSEVQNKDKGPVRPSVFVTPKSTKPLTSTHLRNKLEDWLKVNGHPLDGYRHLRCFGISDNEKPMPSTPARTVDETVENSLYETASSTPLDDSNKENVTPPTVIRQVSLKDAENWLKELHRLIVELKYPAERCEEWLAAIRKKCSSCAQLPVYWECLAALDESKGDLKSAITDYETAIIKGGEVDAVGDSLAQLFDKMVIESGKRSKPKLEKGLDPKNIFKSTIIKFALQQKALKSLSSELEPGLRKQLYVATPVRRSTRIQTPSKPTGEVASLQTLTPEVREKVTFKPNESLLLD